MFPIEKSKIVLAQVFREMFKVTYPRPPNGANAVLVRLKLLLHFTKIPIFLSVVTV